VTIEEAQRLWQAETLTSSMVGLVAAALPDGARVVSTEPEFTSLLWPFLAQERRGVQVDCVPVARLAAAVDERTDVVAASVIQSSTGELADLDAPLRLASDARRFDVSPAWFPWIATAPTLELLLEIVNRSDPHPQPPPRQQLPRRTGPPAGKLSDRPSGAARSGTAPARHPRNGNRPSKKGLLRTSWHVYSKDEDVDELLALLSG
jgi:selenocysteine lyase/cysteine desulfurase